MDPRLSLFGIRHHGPGSAASLLAALDARDPAMVLIEGAPEADELIAYAALPGMQSPLAILHYEADNPANAVFAPFAEYSPEWQAMLWALARGRPVRFIDWPVAHSLALDPEAGEEAAETEDQADPLDRLAEIAGYADGEAWWNALVESSLPGPQVFAAIESAMTELRTSEAEAALLGSRALRNERREAFMRLAIRQALKDEVGPIAAVVGAWHVPGLRSNATAADDRALVRALPKVKVQSAWVPWSDSRLAAASGYGAGVASPGWYRHLWQLHQPEPGNLSPQAFAAGWQARVSHLLREEGMVVASASAIEAARLALTLAAMRGEAAPGLAEMHDATLSALCHGDEASIRMVERRLLLGERVGAIDESVPQMPLAADLQRWQTRCRLKPEDLEREIALDLRSETGLLKSTLLHRLCLLGVEWGKLLDAEAGRGTFRETWLLAWSPILAVRLAEALVYGVTIEQAAGNKALAEVRELSDVSALAERVRACLLADLPEVAERCIERLQAVAVTSGDIAQLMQAIPPLVSILRYGTARPIPREHLSALVAALAAEINAGTMAAACDIEPAEAESLRRAMTAYDDALGLFGDAHLQTMWQAELAFIVRHERAASAVAGLALRLLHDRQAWDVAEISAAFSRALTPPAAPAAAGAFIESFLAGSAEVLVQDRPLLGALDGWLLGLDEADFIESLPMLRRGFADFAPAGRQRILALVGSGQPVRDHAAAAAEDGPNEAFEQALPLLRTILGIEP